jgi:methyl-accepting chemotaxis protein
VNDRFFGKYLAVRDTAFANLIAAKPLGLSGKEWSEASNPGLDAIVGIRDAAISAGAAHLSDSHAAALRSLVVNCTLVLIALGLTLTVYVISRSRVSTPLGQIAAALQQLNEGKLDVALAATRRNDEIGAINDALTLFRDQSLRMREIEQQRVDSERKAADDRKATMLQLADAFQGAVGGIVDTVSSAAGQLASAAGTLTKTAETTQQLSGMVTTASEEASANVQSVATATEELTSSVHEIARQVHESSRIAGEAVKQAERTQGALATW